MSLRYRKSYLYTTPLHTRLLCIKLLLLGVVSAVLVQGKDTEETTPNLYTLYRSYLEANGGRMHIESLSSIAIRGQHQPVDGEIIGVEIYRKRSDKLRLRRIFERYVEEWIYNGREGWRELASPNGYQIELKPMQPEEMEIAQKMCVMEGPFFIVGSREKNIISIVRDVVNGIPAYKIEVNAEAELGYKTIWLDVDSMHEVKIARRIKRAGQPVMEEIYYSELSEVEGHAFYLKQDIFIDGVYDGCFTVQSVRVNVGIYDNYFRVDPTSETSQLN